MGDQHHCPVITAYHSSECHFTPSIFAPRYPIADIAQAAPKQARHLVPLLVNAAE
jgi:hypothetical protein